MKRRKLPRINQFNLSHILSITTIVGAVLALVRILFGNGLLRVSLVFLAGFTVLGSIMFLIGDHELKIEDGRRKQLGLEAWWLLFVIGGLSLIFLMILAIGLQMIT